MMLWIIQIHTIDGSDNKTQTASQQEEGETLDHWVSILLQQKTYIVYDRQVVIPSTPVKSPDA